MRALDAWRATVLFGQSSRHAPVTQTVRRFVAVRRKVKIMSFEEWADLHGEDYPKRKFFSALDWGRGDRTCMTIYCDYCEQPFEIKEDELDDWMVIDPMSGDKAVMCGECESKSKKKKYSHYETCPANNGGTCSCSY